MTKIILAILLCCYLIMTVGCVNFENILNEIDELRNGRSHNGSSNIIQKRSSGMCQSAPFFSASIQKFFFFLKANYWQYDIWYYHYWYYYNYNPAVFSVSQCGNYHCPSQCPGTCGSYSGYFACRCNRCLNGEYLFFNLKFQFGLKFFYLISQRSMYTL
jgi:hypothetical protein